MKCSVKNCDNEAVKSYDGSVVCVDCFNELSSWKPSDNVGFFVRAWEFWKVLDSRWKISIFITLASWTFYFVSRLEWWKVLLLNGLIVYAVFFKKKGVKK